VTRCVCDKSAQNVAKLVFIVEIYMYMTFAVEKRIPKILAASVKKTAQCKQAIAQYAKNRPI
jgi:hypothetical protein